jgi:CubicO group peptidase (beta-lactamase class C family)
MSVFPGQDWQYKTPDAAGFDSQQFGDALERARQAEIGIGPDLTDMLPDGSRHPSDRPLGPVKPRGGTSGVVIRDGFLIGQYGDVNRTEVTFSCSKSYISALTGIAYRDGLLKDLDQPVLDSVRDGGFDSSHNSQITWRQLLQQTSEWQGELFGVPDWIDRGRQVSGAAARGESTVGGSAAKSGNDYRSLSSPGTFWEYNDVRVNRIALSLLRVFGEPLPGVLRREIMNPIGATDTWSWHGYTTSWVEHEGRDMQSVSGGAHWGGGLWINTLDHARFGLLFLNNGLWAGQRVLPGEWVGMTCEPCELMPSYGLLWWLNAGNSISSVADEGAYAARGAGGNIIFVWPAASIVIVLRWSSDAGKVIDAILTSIK